MVKSCIAKYKDNKFLNIDGIIPVIAQQFPINDEMIITPVGVDDLVEKTYAILPEAFKINEDAVFRFKIRIKRANANILTAGVTSASMVVGAIPVPFADSIILTPLQGGLIVGIMKIYGVKNEGDGYKDITGAIISGGVVTIAAKTIISSLKAIPGLNIAAAIINAVVAGIITAVIGEITITISEKIAKGEIKSSDLDWMKKFAESEFLKKSGKYIEQIKKLLKTNDLKKIGKMITDIFKESSR